MVKRALHSVYGLPVHDRQHTCSLAYPTQVERPDVHGHIRRRDRSPRYGSIGRHEIRCSGIRRTSSLLHVPLVDLPQGGQQAATG